MRTRRTIGELAERAVALHEAIRVEAANRGLPLADHPVAIAVLSAGALIDEAGDDLCYAIDRIDIS